MELGFVVVPLRNRPAQLTKFLEKMVSYLAALRTGDKRWTIMIVTQPSGLPFNRGLMFNVAACVLMALARGVRLGAPPRSRDAADAPARIVGGTAAAAAVSVDRHCGDDRVSALLSQHVNWKTVLPKSNGSYDNQIDSDLQDAVAGGRDDIVELIRSARRVFIVMHDVDVLPQGRHFDLQVNQGKPCNYFTPKEGEVVHLYGHTHSLGGVANILLKDFHSIDGFPLACWGWGWEDVALSNRCVGKLRVIRDSTFIDRMALRPHLSCMVEVDMPHTRGDKEQLLRKKMESDVSHLNEAVVLWELAGVRFGGVAALAQALDIYQEEGSCSTVPVGTAHGGGSAVPVGTAHGGGSAVSVGAAHGGGSAVPIWLVETQIPNGFYEKWKIP